MTILKAAFPYYYKDPELANDAINLWAEMLADDDPSYIAKAVKKYIQTDLSGHPPTIGQVRMAALDMKRNDVAIARSEQLFLEAAKDMENSEAMPESLKEAYQRYLGGLKRE